VERLAAALATVFGLGRLPASGTVASAVALPIGWLIGSLGGWQALLVAGIVASLVGIWACGAHAHTLGMEDPSECVLDEVAGQWLALLPMGIFPDVFTWRALLACFVLFRLFDIFKPWPIYRMERWHGGLGIMADDIAAGLFSALLVCIALRMGWL
jgi:phosphatidylglycerophosphatase A